MALSRYDLAVLGAAEVEAAAARLQGVARRTPLERSDRLSDRHGCDVLLKREDLQLCRSYKVRGAYNLVASLSEDERRRGVVCASAGNHAQGVAYVCRALGIHGRIYLPSTTPRQKRERIAAIGGDAVEPLVSGHTYDEASRAAIADAESSGAAYVHPFDDERTIAGQGTVAPEIATEGHVDTVVVPVGGGGLISGIATWVAERRPGVRIVGAEPAGAPSMTAALRKGGPVELDHLDTFVDGAAVGRAGERTFPIVRDLVDEVVTVPEGAVCSEMLGLYQSEGVIAEPAGALASAALRQLETGSHERVVCVVSGGNNDVSRYADIVERSLVFEGLRHYFLVTFPQEPGALRRFLDDVLGPDEDIVLFEYVKKSNRELGPALVGIELARPEDLGSLLGRMEASPLSIELVPPGSPLFTFLV
jgi:threonine dehydratase